MAADTIHLMQLLDESGKNYDKEKIQKAFLYASDLHSGQFRKSGEEYIYHPLAVAEICAELGLDSDAICAALLHDTIEDCPNADRKKIKAEFGEVVEMLVDGLTKLVAIPFEDKEEEHIENLRKMFLAMSKDIRVILIKLCDRLHNMRTLSSHIEEKQRLIALETMHVYAPLAHRLGIQKIKQELESLALGYLDPIGYSEVKKNIEERLKNHPDFIDSIKEEISKKLEEQNMNFSLKGRIKTVYSIYKKMYRQNRPFEDIYDLIAVRVIVDTELDCYTVLGIIHEMYNSMPGRFKDYISTPKANNYRSLHTTVIGKMGIPFEVQIRTWEMNEIAEYGVAAHWKYKTAAKNIGEITAQKSEWIHMLLESEQKSLDSDEFLAPLKTDIFEEETLVFTPGGDVISLPAGSCGIDFAYAIHSGVGNKMIGIKINGSIAPINTILQTGQVIEVLTSSSSKGPSRDWLKIVKTGEAKNKIRNWYKKEKRDENIALAKETLDKEFDHISKDITEDTKQKILSVITEKFALGSIDDLLNCIGYGGIAVSKAATKIKDEYEKNYQQAQIKQSDNPISISEKQRKTKSHSGVEVEGIDNCQIKFAKCCSPLPGDQIIGFITRGFGVSIHKTSCPNALSGMEKDKDRWINASWEDSGSSNNSSYDAVLNICVINKIGVVANICGVLADMKVSITSINTNMGNEKESANVQMTVSARNREHVNMIAEKLRKIQEVIKVTV